MKRHCGSSRPHGLTATPTILLTTAWVLWAAAPSRSAQGGMAPAAPQVTGPPVLRTQIPTEPEREGVPERTSKQKRELLKSNFEKMKENALELATEANALREALEKSNADILSLNIVQRAEKIEKLARKIKEGAKGY